LSTLDGKNHQNMQTVMVSVVQIPMKMELHVWIQDLLLLNSKMDFKEVLNS